jgi:peptidoglycan/xylan/chitin deacetylase (PgdA/CDA1 family)
MRGGVAFLMYHELKSRGRDLCDDDPGYSRYVVTEAEFKRQLSKIKDNGWTGWNVTEALSSLSSERDAKGVCITFDDGCATDLLVAAPILLELKLQATFYVTVNHLDRSGYLTRQQLRELSGLGLEIGSHSLNHRHLNDLNLAEVETELGESRKALEDITGRIVEHFSCPGGRTSSAIKSIASKVGYRSVTTSKLGLNTSKTEKYALTRIAVKEGMSSDTLVRLCEGEGMLFGQVQDAALSAVKRFLGNSVYERVRSAALR